MMVMKMKYSAMLQSLQKNPNPKPCFQWNLFAEKIVPINGRNWLPGIYLL